MPSASMAAAAIVLLGVSGGLVGFLVHEEHRRLTTQESTADWTYGEGADGETLMAPGDWGKTYADCYGDAQSPINLSDSHVEITDNGDFDLKFYPDMCSSDEMSFFAGEHQWMVNVAECSEPSKLSFQDNTYQLINVHIHSVSEHSMGGSCHDAEVHMVHAREGYADELLVVSILMDASDFGENVELTLLWDVFVTGQEMNGGDEFSISPYEMLPASPAYSHYVGSLTTPPCTEGVKWIVMSQTTLISFEQLTVFRKAVSEHHLVDSKGNTNRPVQDLHQRTVFYVGA